MPLDVAMFNTQGNPRPARNRVVTEKVKVAQAEAAAAQQKKANAQRKVTASVVDKENHAPTTNSQASTTAKPPSTGTTQKPNAPKAIPVMPVQPVPTVTQRPPSPVVGSKRPAALVEDPDEANLPRPKRAKRNSKTKPSNRRPRPRASDLPARAQRFVSRAYVAMRSLVSVNPYGTKDEREEMIDLAIARAKATREEDADLEVTEDMRLLVCYAPSRAELITSQISYRLSQMLGDIKRNVSDRFDVNYGLKSSDKKKVVAKNEKIAALLLARNGFVYANPTTRKGLLKNDIITTSCNAIWFSGHDKEGPTFSAIFNPNGDGIPIEILAIVLTALYNCALEWKMGVKKAIPFSEGQFSETYNSMKNMLERYGKHSPDKLVKLRRDLYLAGMSHAGVIIPAPEVELLNDDDFDRAAGDSNSDSESDDEGRYVLPCDMEMESPLPTPTDSPVLGPQHMANDDDVFAFPPEGLTAEELEELYDDPYANDDDAAPGIPALARLDSDEEDFFGTGAFEYEEEELEGED